MKAYANLAMYTDVHPFEVVRQVSDKTIEIRGMKARLAEGQKPKIIPGGFAGHCVNQRELEYVIEPNPQAPVIRARLHKDGRWYSKQGRHYLADEPHYFYDYNF